MPSFQPTLATALVRDGKIVSVIHVGSTHMEFDATNTVPCLILPAPVPIAECPPEWKDGRWVWLFDKRRKRWIKGWWSELDDPKGWATIPVNIGPLTHITLPLPDPTDPRAEEVFRG